MKSLRLNALLIGASMLLSTAAFASTNITEAEVKDAQKRWGDGIVRIGKVMTDGGEYAKEAFDHINAMYDYEHGQVLFKPTLASADPHRPTVGGALSYFVGYDSALAFANEVAPDRADRLKVYKEDKGFATKPWTRVRFENEGIVLHGPTAIAMGNYYFTDLDGNETKVHYTLGFIKRDDAVMIYVQESNLPFSPE